MLKKIMAVPVIQSNGSISGIGEAGQGRNTLVSGEIVTLSDTNPANTGLSRVWSFRDIPSDSFAVLSATGVPTPTFVPDIAGSYWVTCTVNGVDTNTEILAVPLAVTGARIPAFQESGEYDAENNIKGWHESQSSWMRQVDYYLLQNQKSFTPYVGDRPIFVRNTGDDANDGSTIALAVATTARAHQLFNHQEKAYSKQYLELTGFSELIPTVGGGGAQYLLPSTLSDLGNIFNAGSFANGKQDFIGTPIGYYADPVSTGVSIDITSYTEDPVTGLKVANLSGAIVPGAHAGDFISVAPGEWGVIHSNTANTLTIASNFIFTTGATEIYTQSCTLTLQTIFGLQLIANGAVSFNGIRFAGNAFKIFSNIQTRIQLCRFDGGFYTEGPGALLLVNGCYFEGSRMQIEGIALSLTSCVLQNMEIRSHGSGGNGRNTLQSCIIDTCTPYGSSNHEQNFDVEVNNCLFENALTDAIHKQSPYQCLVRNSRINNSGAHAIRADVGGGTCLVDNVVGAGSGGYGIFLQNGAQLAEDGVNTVTGTLGDTKIGSQAASAWGSGERTDVLEANPQFCRSRPWVG